MDHYIPCFRLWVPWWPPSLALRWPVSWWAGAVLDHRSRAVLATLVLPTAPSGDDVCAMLERAVAASGRAPRHIVSDQGPQFRERYRAWCEQRGAGPRYGAVGNSGSIAVIERFFRTLKQECFGPVAVPLRLEAVRTDIAAYVRWYNHHRPHSLLAGATPHEVLRALEPACTKRPLEPRHRMLRSHRHTGLPPPKRCTGLRLVVTHVEGRKHLPVFELDHAA